MAIKGTSQSFGVLVVVAVDLPSCSRVSVCKRNGQD